ncbi:MAG: hypothetical protein VYA55_03125 [Pseudomonadota bacterium]|nr:hypothetical protein [Pseudomonadota bacterium]
MNRLALGTSVILISAGIASNVLADGDQHQKRWNKDTLAVHMIGTDIVEERIVPDIDGDGVDDLARCFDMELRDVRTGRVIGHGADCVANLTPVGSGLQIDATYYLELNNGSLVIRGKNSAQPVLRETVTTVDGYPYTHSVAASGDWDAMLEGTGIYADRGGRLRVSGLMNISNVLGTPEDSAFLDLILLIKLD